ncbi:predicted protein [Histoplasma capsulatum H143]|uniref:Uncharacterized protein n=1 Tax=Ajellomyces capsulatus (strain H143) TaxID=544712 RepID=C6HQ77_AJECH|nr:predicted protein [Histoplasma capsulatum H143]
MAARMQDQGPWQSLRRSLRLLLVASPNVSSRTNTPNQGNKLRKISPEVATPEYENTLEPSGANYGEGQKYQQTERRKMIGDKEFLRPLSGLTNFSTIRMTPFNTPGPTHRDGNIVFAPSFLETTTPRNRLCRAAKLIAIFSCWYGRNEAGISVACSTKSGHGMAHWFLKRAVSTFPRYQGAFMHRCQAPM